jgi:hypothetical protein
MLPYLIADLLLGLPAVDWSSRLKAEDDDFWAAEKAATKLAANELAAARAATKLVADALVAERAATQLAAAELAGARAATAAARAATKLAAVELEACQQRG